MTECDKWNAFGADSDDDDDDIDDEADADDDGNAIIDDSSNDTILTSKLLLLAARNDAPFTLAADETILHMTMHFHRLMACSGVTLKKRVVGIDVVIRECEDRKREGYHKVLAERVRNKGMNVLDHNISLGEHCSCDGAMVLIDECFLHAKYEQLSCMKRSILPGGSLWMIVSLDKEDVADDPPTIDKWMQTMLEDFSSTAWDVTSAVVIYKSSRVRVIVVERRPCVVNSWSCPWMEKDKVIKSRLCSSLNEQGEGDEDFHPVIAGETSLQYEQRVASAMTIITSVAERTSTACKNGTATTTNSEETPVLAIVLTEENIKRASEMLQKYGLVIIKGLLPPSQTVPWGNAVLNDFNSAVTRLKYHPTRPVDLMNPRTTTEISEEMEDAFEPLSYKEMAMREDLRVDLRSGPEMEKLRMSENNLAVRSMMAESSTSKNVHHDAGASNDGPTIIHADATGTVDSWRFHPSILAVIKRVFNPRKGTALSKGNFGRWNFGGSGPDGSPQPFRLGQIGSVISCPGSGDQAIHADTPHLFEHEDCLPCHYLNVFTPGYHVVDDQTDDSVDHEFIDGIWTGNSTMGGTALVYGSHKLSVSAQLLSEEDAGGMKDDNDAAASSTRKKMLWLRTLRPALEAGDVLLFDCRIIHYGLGNTSKGDKLGRDVNAGRRPMLYVNATQSWFHDPKNWDDREKIFG